MSLPLHLHGHFELYNLLHVLLHSGFDMNLGLFAKSRFLHVVRSRYESWDTAVISTRGSKFH